MLTHWEDLLVEGPGNEKILCNTANPDTAWQVWGKQIRKRAQSLGLEHYRAAVHWCYAQPQTKACFENEIPVATEWSEIASAGHDEYHSLASSLTNTLLAEWTETQTSRQWTNRLLMLEQWHGDLAQEQLSIEHQPLLHQVNCAEKPWLIGCMFPGLTVGQRMLHLARENFRRGLAEILDGSGLPHAADIMLLRPLLACWTRALMIGKKAKLRPWPSDDHHQYEWAVLHSLRLMRKDGSAVFGETVPFEFEMMQYALAFDMDETDHAVARTLFPRQFAANEIAKIRATMTQKPTSSQQPIKKTTATKTAEQAATVDATYFSEWSQMAVLRSGWNFREPSLAVAFAPIQRRTQNAERRTQSSESGILSEKHSELCTLNSALSIELNLGGQTLWSGSWDVAVRLDGRTLLPIDTWSTACEIAEENGSYLEIELPLAENMRLQRHLLLCHKEKLLLLADAVLPQYEDNIEWGIEHLGFDDARYAIEYESQLPLAHGIGIKSSAEMTELLLTVPGTGTGANVGKSIRVFPLALPEWKAACTADAEKSADFVAGELSCAGTNDRHRLILRQNAVGRGMFSPLLFDLDAKRVKQPYTWRQLTVGENLEQVAHDRAVAFRLQIEKMHILLYRSLTSPLNRTFFGHNLVSDFFTGRFDAKTGKVSPIVETE